MTETIIRVLFILGELSEEEEVLQWLITQKTEDRIELITRQMLETMVEDTQYLAVYFCKFHSFLIENIRTIVHFVFDFENSISVLIHFFTLLY